MKLELKNICVNFSLKTVLKDVNITLEEGKIYALLGDNGAGKTTLANILSGELQPSSGEIYLNQKQIHIENPKMAIQNGICYVHQRPMVADTISIRENLMLGIKDKFSNSQLEEICSVWLGDFKLSTLVQNLGSDSKFFVALINALLKKPSLLILDEPSALLDNLQRDFLYENLQKMAAKGTTILVITHNFLEAEKYCHKTVRLENGKIQEFLSQKQLEISPAKKNDCGSLKIQFNKITSRPQNQPAIFDLNFSVAQGDIVFIQGLPEDGLQTLENLITGYNLKFRKGSISIFDNEIEIYNTNLKSQEYSIRHLRKGLSLKNGKSINFGILPTDKKFRASDPKISIKQMLTLNRPFINSLEMIKISNINITEKEKAANLSGGMLQRLLLNRELFNNPEVLILCNPMQGLDIEACELTCNKIKTAAENGAMVIILSTSDFSIPIFTQKFKLSAGILEKVS